MRKKKKHLLASRTSFHRKRNGTERKKEGEKRERKILKHGF